MTGIPEIAARSNFCTKSKFPFFLTVLDNGSAMTILPYRYDAAFHYCARAAPKPYECGNHADDDANQQQEHTHYGSLVPHCWRESDLITHHPTTLDSEWEGDLSPTICSHMIESR
jgi:hypothetical protein